MNSKKGRIFIVVLLALAIALYYSTDNSVEAGKKNTSSGSGWNSWNGDDGSSGHKGHGKGHDDDSSSGHKPKKKKKPKREWLTKGNANIDSEKHFLGTTDEADLVIKTNNTEKARVTIDGDVGIGTASPTGTLHVNGGTADADTDGKNVTIEAQDGGPTTGLGGNIVLTPGIDGDGASSGTVYVGEIDSLDPPILTLDVNGQIRIRGGSPFAGGVLTSDSDGIATWQSVDDADADPTNELQALTQTGNSVTLSHGGGSVTVADNDNDSSNELQTISKSGNDVTLSLSGGSVSVDDGDSDSTNELQNLSSSAAGTSRTIDISSGTGTNIDVADNDNDPTNEENSSVTLNGTLLEVTDSGGTKSADLSSLSDTDWTEGGGNVFRSTGNVGIGTPSPLTKLQVIQDSEVAASVGGTGTFDVGLQFLNWGRKHAGIRYSGDQLIVEDASATHAPSTWFSTGQTPLDFIVRNGKVGIGTSTPITLLHAFGASTGNIAVDRGDPAGGFASFDLFNNQNGGTGWSIQMQPNNNDLSFLDRAAGLTRVTIDQGTGNVGVGTTTPQSQLSLGNNLTNTKLALWDNGAGGLIGLGIQAGTFRFHLNQASDAFRFYNAPAGNELMALLGNGRVGIGTATPNAKLHIGGSIAGGLRNWMENGVIVGKSGESDGGYFGVKDEGPNRQDTVIAWGDDFQDSLRFIFNLSGGAANGDEAMRITASGNVGIGTATPGAKLDIAGNIKIADGTQGAGEVLTSDTNGLATWEPIPIPASLWSLSGGNVFRSAGGVGIGTSSPTQKLDVLGDINLSAATGGIRWLNASTIGMRREGEFISILNESRIGHFLDSNSNQTNAYFAVFHDGATEATAAELFRVQENGRVGIGTTSPIASLDVAGEVALTSNSARLRLMRETGTNFIDYEDSNAFGIRSMNIDNTNIVDRLKIDTLGRFAIGTTNTGNAKFVINGDDTTSLRLENFGTTRESSMRFVTKTLNASTNFHADIALKSTSNSGGIGYLGFKVPFNNTAGAGYDMVINNEGKVGIGTTTPGAELHLAGSDNTPQLLIKPATMLGGDIAKITFQDPDGGTAPMDIRYKDDGVADLAIMGGRVGIGIENPGGSFEIKAINSSARIGGALGSGQSTGLQFLDSGNQHAGLRWSAVSGSSGGTLVLEAASNGANPSNWYNGSVVNLLVRKGNLNVQGSIQHNGSTVHSDRRFKKEIRPLERSLDKTLKLNGVSYKWNVKEFPDKGFTDDTQIGFLAQELEEVYPELVHTDSDGYKSVSYEKVTAILVEAVKELKADNDELRAKLSTLADKHEAIVDMLLASSTELPEEKLASLNKKEKK